MFHSYQVLNEIRLSTLALHQNLEYFKSQNPQAEIAPVLKSNAYGHGLKPILQFLVKQDTFPYICVDSLYEAYELEKIGLNKPILVLGYTMPENYKTIKPIGFTVTVFDLETLAILNKHQPGIKVHLKIDTGMHRLGIQPSQVSDYIHAVKAFNQVKFEGIFSHLSQADDPAKTTFTNNQIKLLKNTIQQFRSAKIEFKWRHIANTAGASFIRDKEFNMLRLGLGLYGLSPFGAHSKMGSIHRKKLQPVLSLQSHLAQVKTIPPGSQVGYRGTHKAKHHETIGILPLGYNEGFNRGLSNQGILTDESGKECPVCGIISMNMTTIKLPKSGKYTAGDRINVIADNPDAPNSIYRFSQILKTIPYTVITGLHPSIRRTLI